MADQAVPPDERPFPPGEYPIVIVGSGPGALQVSYFLGRLGIEHAVISGDPGPGEAVVRGIRLIELEQQWHIYWELEMQSWILDHFWLIKVMNWVYFWGHMPLVIAAFSNSPASVTVKTVPITATPIAPPIDREN